MAYKRQSPMPIIEGGSNTSTITNNYGVLYYDGSLIASTTVGTASHVLTSTGAGSAPVFASGSGAGSISWIATAGNCILGGGFAGTNYVIPYSQYESQPLDPSGATQAQAQWPIPVSGTISNMFVYITPGSAPATGPNNITLYVNMSASALTLVRTAGGTGIFSNQIDSVAVTAGDLLQFAISNAGGTDIMRGQIVVQLTT